MLLFRDRFLKNLFERFTNTFDLEEIWTIVQDLNEQAIKINTQYMDFSQSSFTETSSEINYQDHPDSNSEESREQEFGPEQSNIPVDKKSGVKCVEMMRLADNDSYADEESE